MVPGDIYLLESRSMYLVGEVATEKVLVGTREGWTGPGQAWDRVDATCPPGGGRILHDRCRRVIKVSMDGRALLGTEGGFDALNKVVGRKEREMV